MQINRLIVNLFVTGAILSATGCVERRVAYVPVYQRPPPGPPPAYAAPAPAATAPVVATQVPPPARVEVMPVAPGPYYAWTPGYWSWQGRWVWISGAWVMPPRPRAVWVGGQWSRHGRGWIWVGGHWR